MFLEFEANNTLAFLHQNRHIHSTKLKTTAYITLLRHLLEYGAHCGIPAQQVPFTRLRWFRVEVPHTSTCSTAITTPLVSKMLQQLGWCTLQKRRETLKVSVQCTRCTTPLYFNTSQYITPSTRLSRNSHPLYYIVPHSRTEQHLQSLFPAVRQRNSLPKEG